MKKERKLIIAGNWEMNKAVGEVDMTNMREESKSLSVVEVSADKLSGAQTQRSLEHFSKGGENEPSSTAEK